MLRRMKNKDGLIKAYSPFYQVSSTFQAQAVSKQQTRHNGSSDRHKSTPGLNISDSISSFQSCLAVQHQSDFAEEQEQVQIQNNGMSSKPSLLQVKSEIAIVVSL